MADTPNYTGVAKTFSKILQNSDGVNQVAVIDAVDLVRGCKIGKFTVCTDDTADNEIIVFRKPLSGTAVRVGQMQLATGTGFSSTKRDPLNVLQTRFGNVPVNMDPGEQILFQMGTAITAGKSVHVHAETAAF